MKRRKVIFSDEAESDLLSILTYLAPEMGILAALEHVELIRTFCDRLDLASQRGKDLGDLRPGLRLVGFRRQMSIAFEVTDETVAILRIFLAGRDWEDDLTP